jgi:hypothetical protein
MNISSEEDFFGGQVDHKKNKKEAERSTRRFHPHFNKSIALYSFFVARNNTTE